MDDSLAAAAARFRSLEKRTEAAREDLALEIVAATAAGRRQAEIARIAGYTREQVRRIVRARE